MYNFHANIHYKKNCFIYFKYIKNNYMLFFILLYKKIAHFKKIYNICKKLYI